MGDRLAAFVDGNKVAELRGLSLPPEGLLGSVARVDDLPLAALNTMLFEDGALIDLPEGADGGAIELLSLIQSNDRPVAVHPRHVVRLAAGAKLVLIERAIGRGDLAALVERPPDP